MSTSQFWGNIFKAKENAEDSIHIFLKKNIIFENFSNSDIHKMSKILHLRKFSKNDTIFKEGEPGSGMYIIRKGNVKITKLDNTSSKNPTSKHIITLKPSHFFGELSLIEKEKIPRNASAFAETDCELFGFFKPDLLELIERDPRLSIKIILRISELVGARLRATTTSLSRKIMLLQKLNVENQEESNK